MSSTSFATIVVRFISLYVILRGVAGLLFIPFMVVFMYRFELPPGVPAEAAKIQGKMLGITFPASSLGELFWISSLLAVGTLFLGVFVFRASDRIGNFVANRLD